MCVKVARQYGGTTLKSDYECTFSSLTETGEQEKEGGLLQQSSSMGVIH